MFWTWCSTTGDERDHFSFKISTSLWMNINNSTFSIIIPDKSYFDTSHNQPFFALLDNNNFNDLASPPVHQPELSNLSPAADGRLRHPIHLPCRPTRSPTSSRSNESKR